MKQQVADEETNAAYWKTQIGLADEIAKKDRATPSAKTCTWNIR